MAQAADFYVSQSGAGLLTGTSCADAQSLAWANDAASYGGAGEPTAGDTIHLCGTFTSRLLPPASGTTNAPITFLFEPGANFTATDWPDGAIRLDGRSWIVIDGGNAPVNWNGGKLASCSTAGGVIRATGVGAPQLGTGLAFVASFGVYAASGTTGDYVTIRNLNILDTYQRRLGDPDPPLAGGPVIKPTGIYLGTATGTPVTIEYNCIKNAWNHIQGGDVIRGNFFENAANSIIPDCIGLVIDRNVLGDSMPWQNSADHFDGIHCFTGATFLHDIAITNNFFTVPPFGTAIVYMETQAEQGGRYDNVLIANNYFYAPHAGVPGNGMYTGCGPGATNVKILNNTFYAPYSTDPTALMTANDCVSPVVMNNLFVKVGTTAHYSFNATITPIVDYNYFGNVSPQQWKDWRNLGFEAHGATYGEPIDANPIFTSTPSEKLVGYCARISGSLGAPEISPVATGTGVTPDPPAFDPSWATADTLWFAMYAAQFGAATTFPANYTNPLTVAITGAGGLGAGIAARTANVASENPGTFTLDTSWPWIATTVAVRPSGAAPPTLHSLTQCGINTVDDTSHRVTPMPAGLKAGDLWLLFTAIDNTGGALTYAPPAYAGWTEVGSLGTNPKIWVWYKIATHMNQLAVIPTIGLGPASVAIGAGMPRAEPELQNDRMGCPRGVDAWTVGVDNGTCRRGGL
jgi:hypothetical protein